MENLKEYRKTATVKAKLFENGDEDGFIHEGGLGGALEDLHFGINPELSLVPFVSTLENQHYRGEFGKQYICVGVNGERWLVDKDIFEKTYVLVDKKINKHENDSEQSEDDALFTKDLMTQDEFISKGYNINKKL